MQDACHTASNRLASNCTRISWTPVVKNEHLILNLNFLKFWHCDPCPGPRGRATHWIKLGTTSEETKKPVYRDAPFSLLIKFSQIKNIYTSRKNILVKIRLEWKSNFYCLIYMHGLIWIWGQNKTQFLPKIQNMVGWIVGSYVNQNEDFDRLINILNI